jgi:hypothetical protein
VDSAFGELPGFADAPCADFPRRAAAGLLRHTTIACNSCRNRHCPKCQAAADREGLAAREAELLPLPYFHVVFTLPSAIGDIAYQNQAVVYDLLFKASSEAVLTIAADPKHLGSALSLITGSRVTTESSEMRQTKPHSTY